MTEDDQPKSPIPKSPAVSARMQKQKARDTGIEQRLRSILHRRGLRFRIHQKLIAGRKGEADIVFRKAKLAVFVDNCFWHQCPEHGSIPTSNRTWWKNKLNRNRTRDLEVNDTLRSEGWTVIRIWEHEDLNLAAEQIERTLRKFGGR